MSFHVARSCACVAALLPALASAQATVKPDGQLRYALGAGASYSSGNTSAASANVAADGVRATDDNKWVFGGKALWSRADGSTTASNVALATQYDQNFTPVWFGFGSADYLHDQFANLSARYAAHGGVGRHMVKSETLTFDLSAGVGYTEDRYLDPADIHGELRDNFGRAEAVLAEETSYQWTPTTSLHQKLSFYPAISNGGGYRGVFDSGLAVAMTPRLNLTVGLTYRYNSDPGTGFRKGDTLFVTGIAMKFD